MVHGQNSSGHAGAHWQDSQGPAEKGLHRPPPEITKENTLLGKKIQSKFDGAPNNTNKNTDINIIKPFYLENNMYLF